MSTPASSGSDPSGSGRTGASAQASVLTKKPPNHNAILYAPQLGAGLPRKTCQKPRRAADWSSRRIDHSVSLLQMGWGGLGWSRIELQADTENRPLAVIGPAKSHPDVIVAAVAARDQKRANAYAKLHGIPIVHTSYQGAMVWFWETSTPIPKEKASNC